MVKKSKSTHKSKYIRSYYKFFDIYKQSLLTLQNWIIAINAGGAVSIVSFVAAKNMSSIHGFIILSFIAFLIGLSSGLLWVFITLLEAGTWRKQLQIIIEKKLTLSNPKAFQPSCALCILAFFAWLLGIISTVAMGTGIYSGLLAVTHFNNQI